MALAVVTVAARGLPVVEVAGYGLPITEAANGLGIAVTKVVGKPGLPVTFVNADGGPVAPPFTATAWNPADKSNNNLTNNNLTATSTITAGGVRALVGRSSGKYYWELTISAWANNGTGMALSLGTVALSGSGVAGQAILAKAGGIFINASSVGTLGARASGDKIGMAVDLSGKLIWYRVTPSGNWNGSGAADPATGVGGLNITLISTGSLFPHFVTAQSGEVGTANFGASAFNGAVPSGFTAGWPA